MRLFGLELVPYLPNNFNPSVSNQLALFGDPLLHHLVLYVQLVVPCHVHRIQMHLVARQGVESYVDVDAQLLSQTNINDHMFPELRRQVVVHLRQHEDADKHPS